MLKKKLRASRSRIYNTAGYLLKRTALYRCTISLSLVQPNCNRSVSSNLEWSAILYAPLKHHAHIDKNFNQEHFHGIWTTELVFRKKNITALYRYVIWYREKLAKGLPPVGIKIKSVWRWSRDVALSKVYENYLVSKSLSQILWN